MQAAIDLARADDARGVAALDALVGDGEPTVRRAAAAGYLAAHRPGAGRAPAPGDDSPPVRLAAAEGILKLYPRD
ncbi:MAG: hypothetical protein H6709_14530 [Kofleriaceae bacterium]|nr:hypothetical protein [Kofleriaceae bacterium]